MASPYPWHYTLRWLYFYFRPSVKNHTDLPKGPLVHDFGPSEDICRFMFFGDLMCMRHDRIPEVHPDIASIMEQADYVVGNCESPVVFDELRPDAMHLTHFGMAKAFLSGFFEALHVDPTRCAMSIANNHMGDRGVEGVKKTVDRLEALSVVPLGAPESAVARVEVDGLQVGLTAWTRWLNFEVFSDKQGVLREPPQIDRNGLDTLIATPHWEFEFQHYPRADTRAHARRLIEDGVDLIVGHHPHVLQPVEHFDGGVCLYSIGNLNGPSYSRVSWPVQLGAIFEVRLHKSGPKAGKVQGYTVHPFAQVIHPDRSASLMPIEHAPDPLRSQLRGRLAHLFEVPAVAEASSGNETVAHV